MSWFQRIIPPKIKRKENGEKKAVPEGLWSKCASCEAVLYYTDLVKNLEVCPKCSHHNRISARKRIDLLLDPDERHEIGEQVTPQDPLKFKDSKRYTDRLAQAHESTNEEDALVVMQGSIKTVPVVVAAFEFGFMGGSMGSVVGERFIRAVQVCIERHLPFICITASGGARMQEGLFSLMQMAKTSAALTQMSKEKLPFISIALGCRHSRYRNQSSNEIGFTVFSTMRIYLADRYSSITIHQAHTTNGLLSIAFYARLTYGYHSLLRNGCRHPHQQCT